MPHYDLGVIGSGGGDPAESVPDPNCRAHELSDQYVPDASFLPSTGAVDPRLTIIDNALRVGAYLAETRSVEAHLQERLVA